MGIIDRTEQWVFTTLPARWRGQSTTASPVQATTARGSSYRQQHGGGSHHRDTGVCSFFNLMSGASFGMFSARGIDFVTDLLTV